MLFCILQMENMLFTAAIFVWIREKSHNRTNWQRFHCATDWIFSHPDPIVRRVWWNVEVKTAATLVKRHSGFSTVPFFFCLENCMLSLVTWDTWETQTGGTNVLQRPSVSKTSAGVSKISSVDGNAGNERAEADPRLLRLSRKRFSFTSNPVLIRGSRVVVDPVSVETTRRLG